MTIKYQIFVSSTFIDLEEERRVAMEQILNLGHIPVGMELFHAADSSQWSYITKRIKECDYYLLIMGDRYGSVGPNNKSYTQLEYEFAIKSGIPTIAFLLHREARQQLPRGKVEFERADEIAKFRSLAEKKLVKYWRTADDLGGKIVTSLIQLIQERPRVGWVRADTTAPAAALQEISKLSDEKRVLQQRVRELEIDFNSNAVPSDVVDRIQMLSTIKCTDIAIDRQTRLPIKISNDFGENASASLMDILLAFSRAIATGVSESSLSFSMSDYLTSTKHGYHLECKPIISELAAENIIEIKYVQTTVFEELKSERVVHSTEYGKNLIYHARRIRTQAATDITRTRTSEE